jgi:zinc protease
LLGVLADCIQNPVFPSEQVERLRAQLLTGLAIRAQDTAEVSSLAFDRLLFGRHPYGYPEDGEVETIQRITCADLVDFHRKYFGPRGMVVVIVGAVHPQAAVEAIQRALEGWKNPRQAPPLLLQPVQPPVKTIRRHFTLAGKTQTDLLMGTLGPARTSPDYMAVSLGNNILGQFGMMGRIGDVVRERAGLAYQASASINSGIVSGSWEVSAGVNPVNLRRAIDLILEELRRFISEPVRNSELSDSKANYIGRLPLSMESNAGVANALLNLERFHLGLDYYRQYPGLIKAIKPLQILEAAGKYIDPEKLVIVSAGPKK